MSRPFAVTGFSMLFTLALLFFLPEEAVFFVLGLCAVGFVVSLLLRQKGAVPAALASVGLACLLTLLQLANVYYPALQNTGENLEIRARVTSNADMAYGRYYYQAETIAVNGESRRLRLRLSSPYPLYAEPYDEITYTGAVFLLGQDDPEMTANYKARGIYLGSYAQSYGEDRFEVTHTKSFHPMRQVLRLQRMIGRALQARYDGEDAALLRGMLLGDVSGLSWSAGEDFRAAGIYHIFSVSGLHMSLLAWSVFRALRALGCREKLAAVLGSAFVLLFMAVTGFSAPCVRAGIVMLVLMAGELFSRKADSLNSLGLAAMILMLISPLSAGQLGLQLSFGAALGIVLFQGRLSAPMKKSKWVKPLWEGLCVTAAALVLTMPVQLLRLPGGVSLLTFPANLLFVPVSGAAMILGGLSLLLPPLSYLTAPLCRLMLWGVHRLVGVPAPLIQGDGAVLALVFAFCAAVAAAALLLRYFGRPLRLRYTAALLCAAVVLGGWLPEAVRGGHTRLQRLETGAGLSYLLSDGKRAALLGCGGDQLPAGAAKRALSALGLRELELLLLPGYGEFLSGGAAELRRDVPIKQVFDGADMQGGYTLFTLWEGTYCDFYADGSDIACRITMPEETFILHFSGNLPEPWGVSALAD